VFHFYGRKWPVDGDAAPAAPWQALPLLEELVWECSHMVDGFAGAQPVVLCAPHHTIAEYVAASQRVDCGPLARLRSLQFDGYVPCAGWVRDRLGWHSDPAFAGLIHRKLRSLHFKSDIAKPTDVDRFFADYDELQARHFPRLRAFVLQ
jgi:hypothetical protein